MTSGQWANIGDDAGALHALVEQIRDHVAVSNVDYLWLFPPRKVAAGESIVMVIGAFDDDPERRRVGTAHFTVSRNRKGAATVNLHYDEHGSAPVAAVPRIVHGVLRRLGEDTEASPREEQIGGHLERWDALITDLGGVPRPALVASGDAADAGDQNTAATATDRPEPMERSGAEDVAARTTDDNPDAPVAVAEVGEVVPGEGADAAREGPADPAAGS